MKYKLWSESSVKALIFTILAVLCVSCNSKATCESESMKESQESPLVDIGLSNEEYNASLDSIYGCVIPAIVEVYATYDSITGNSENEADAAFLWHDIAARQIAKMYGRQEATIEETDSFLNAIEGILGYYACGTQCDMNESAWRWVMISDYKLIAAYKALYDCCDSPSLQNSIKASYLDVLEAYRKRCETIEGTWSDLPRELACMQTAMMDEQRGRIELLISQYKNGETTIAGVKKELDKRPFDNNNWDIDDY